MGQVTERYSPWIGIAREDAGEWWRDNQGAPLAAFDAWVAEYYEPHILFGMGYRPTLAPRGRRLNQLQKNALDDVHEGLYQAVQRRKRDPDPWTGPPTTSSEPSAAPVLPSPRVGRGGRHSRVPA